jgi:hypothetical protein
LNIKWWSSDNNAILNDEYTGRYYCRWSAILKEGRTNDGDSSIAPDQPRGNSLSSVNEKYAGECIIKASVNI